MESLPLGTTLFTFNWLKKIFSLLILFTLLIVITIITRSYMFRNYFHIFPECNVDLPAFFHDLPEKALIESTDKLLVYGHF